MLAVPCVVLLEELQEQNGHMLDRLWGFCSEQRGLSNLCVRTDPAESLIVQIDQHSCRIRWSIGMSIFAYPSCNFCLLLSLEWP